MALATLVTVFGAIIGVYLLVRLRYARGQRRPS